MNKLLFFLIIICFGFTSETISIKKSIVQFTGSHPFHDWTGISTQLETNFSCNQNNRTCDFNFSIPWMSFNSDNDNRDNNMLYYVNAFDYPKIYMKFDQINLNELNEDEKLLTGIITISGINNKISIPLEYHLEENQFKVSSSFHISLKNFKIKRPTLLLIPIEDLIFINVNITGYII